MFSLRFTCLLASVAVFFLSCGNSDNTNSSQIRDDGTVKLYGAKVATTASKLPACDSTQVGQLFFVLADEEFQFCSTDGYQTIDLRGAAGENGADGADGVKGTTGTKGADGLSCSVISNSDDSKTILCEDGTTATVSDGASCTVADNDDGSYDLTCSGTTVTVRDGVNGEDGVNGKDGVDGINCIVSDDGAGTLTQTCGVTSVSWPKAVCGLLAYEPSTHFCDVGTSAPMVAWATHCLVPGNCGTFADTRETPAKQYKWTKIGSQIWMAENLAYLPSVNATADTSRSEAKYYVHGYDGTVVADAKATSNYTTYGVLYNWPAASTVCPTGWHLPSDPEWLTLIENAGENHAGTKLKSKSGWTIGADIETDDYGFSALPSGSLWVSFRDLLVSGVLWSATEGTPNYPSCWSMHYVNASVNTVSTPSRSGFSVRCIQGAVQ